MSIISAVCADHSNEVKKEWTKKLREAYEKQSWEEIDKVIKEIEDYYFDE